VVGLGEEVVDAEASEGGFVLGGDGGGADEDFLVGVVLAEAPADLDPGETGEVQIDQGEVEGSVSGEPADAVGAVAGFDHLKGGASEELGDEPA
jgi:hypothetical protein